MHKFRKLEIWQIAMDFVVEIYQFTKDFPEEEKYGLISQIRRAATSIPLNIAEGSGSGSDSEFRRFLHFAYRSAHEVITALELSSRLDMCNKKEVPKLIDRADAISGKIWKLIDKLDIS